jgi:hypothetical protein
MTYLTWEAHEHTFKEKNADWYWAVGIIAVSIAAVSIILNDVLFAIFVIVGAFALCLSASKHPALLTYEISDRGVRVDNTLYLYNNLDSFWVETTEHDPKLIIKSKKLFMPYIIAHLDNESPDDVRTVLLGFLKEEEHSEPFGQKVMEFLGF